MAGLPTATTPNALVPRPRRRPPAIVETVATTIVMESATATRRSAPWRPVVTYARTDSSACSRRVTSLLPELLTFARHSPLILSARAHVLAGLGIDELRFAAPVRPGDRLSLTTEWLDARLSSSKTDRGIVRSLLTLTNQDGEPILTTKEAILVARSVNGRDDR